MKAIVQARSRSRQWYKRHNLWTVPTVAPPLAEFTAGLPAGHALRGLLLHPVAGAVQLLRTHAEDRAGRVGGRLVLETAFKICCGCGLGWDICGLGADM